MTYRHLGCACLAVALVLAGCAGTREPEQASATQRESRDRSARLAFDQGQYQAAATLYQASLRAAMAEDDSSAIVDARFNLALCMTYLGDHSGALAETALASAERQRRGLPMDPELQLLVGTIQYRAGDLDRAQAVLATVLTDGAASAATRAKAHFVAGLVAADLGSASLLREHLTALGNEAGNGNAADRVELQARLSALQGDVTGAVRSLDQAAALRRNEGDYQGMVRVLATAGELAERAGRLEAAGDYFLRAGRSAAQRDEARAGQWLDRARDLGVRSGDQALVREAEAVLRSIQAGG